MKRVFIALPLSKSLTNKILRWQAQHGGFPVRWIADKNLHITIVPPWEVENIKEVTKIIQEVAKDFSPIDLEFSNIQFGANPESPRLIWAKSQTPPVLVELKKKLEDKLGQKPETRALQTHITLARFRPNDFIRFPIKKLDDHISWTATFDKLVLMESHLSEKGADYEILHTEKLS